MFNGYKILSLCNKRVNQVKNIRVHVIIYNVLTIITLYNNNSKYLRTRL